jgi:hypothetical protein
LLASAKFLADLTHKLALGPGEALIIRANHQDVLVDPALTFDLFAAGKLVWTWL